MCRTSPQCEQKQQLDLRSIDSRLAVDSGAGFSSQAPGAEGFSEPRILLSSALRMRVDSEGRALLVHGIVAGSEPECRAERVHIEPDRSPVCVQTPIYQIDKSKETKHNPSIQPGKKCLKWLKNPSFVKGVSERWRLS